MSRRFRSKSELRSHVQRILKSPIPDEVWRYADDENMVSEVLQGENTTEWIAEKLRRLINLGQPQVAEKFITAERRQRRGKTSYNRQEAISEALAAIARQSEEVRSFRRKFLNDQLIQFEEVERWIKERTRQDETYPHALLVRLKHGFTLDYCDGWQLDPPISSVGSDEIEGLAPVDCVEYGRPGSTWVHRIPIGRDGTLRFVFQLTMGLVNRFCWQGAQATVFLLTDTTPLVAIESVELRRPPATILPWGGGLLALACLSRITLTIDPMMTPREVGERYAKLRGTLIARKPRTQSEKHLQLAVFAVERAVLDKEAMSEWGRKFPDWKYGRVSIFARDARAARERLLHNHPVDLLRKPLNRA